MKKDFRIPREAGNLGAKKCEKEEFTEQRTFELHKNLQGSKTIAEKAKRTEQRFHLLATQETEFGVPQS